METDEERGMSGETPESNSRRSLYSPRNVLIFSLVLALVGACGFVAWKNFYNQPHEEELRKPAAVSTPVVKVVSKTLFREDQLPSEVEAYQDVLIYPKVPGFVKWLGVDRGSVVKEGQLIAEMYAPEYLASRNEGLARVANEKAALAVEESNLQDVQAELKKRQANLLADQSTYQRVYSASLVPGVIADNDVVQWAQSVEEDKQEVNSLIKRVNAKAHEVEMRRQGVNARLKGFESDATFASYLQITAPFNGYITERKLHVGSLVGPDGGGAYPPICRLQQLDLLRIIAPVPERDTAGVVLGSEVQFTVSSFPGRRFTGTVARISDTLEKETRTMPVELNFFNPDYKILPGMFCEVYWPTRRREASLFVPFASVVSTPLDTFVCKIKDGVVEWVSVKKGQVMNGLVEIFGDVKEGDLVAQEGSEELQNESKVKAVAAEVKPLQ
jgi:membrane fusion protein (multidrug efflux system)